MRKTFYIYKSGILQRKDDSLVLILKNNDYIYIPILQVDVIIVFGEVTLNKRVFSLLNLYHVSIFFMNFYGNYIGRFTPKTYADGKIIKEQIQAYSDYRRLIIAQIIVRTELKNMLSFVKYYNKKYVCFMDEIDSIAACLNNVMTMHSVEDLLLIEAQAKRAYYSIFDRILIDPNFQFEKRSMHPPKNEVNAMLSYGYAILYAQILSDIDRSPLIPNISFIHSLSKQSDSLQFDLADMYKAVIIDRLVIRLVNRHQMQTSMFIHNPNGSVYLTKEATKVYIEEYEKVMQKSVKIGKRYYSYRNIITRDVYELANYLVGKKQNYDPFTMRW